DPVPGDRHDVVDATEEPEIAILVALGAVAREVDVVVLRPVLLHETVGVAPDAAEHARPRLAEHEITCRCRFALLVEHLGVDAWKQESRRARLENRERRQRRDEDVTRLGLPPRVHDGATAPADDLPVPHPGLRVDRLADGAEQPQAREIATLRVFVAPLHERTNRGRRRVTDRYDVLAPE